MELSSANATLAESEINLRAATDRAVALEAQLQGKAVVLSFATATLAQSEINLRATNNHAAALETQLQERQWTCPQPTPP